MLLGPTKLEDDSGDSLEGGDGDDEEGVSHLSDSVQDEDPEVDPYEETEKKIRKSMMFGIFFQTAAIFCYKLVGMLQRLCSKMSDERNGNKPGNQLST